MSWKMIKNPERLQCTKIPYTRSRHAFDSVNSRFPGHNLSCDSAGTPLGKLIRLQTFTLTARWDFSLTQGVSRPNAELHFCERIFWTNQISQIFILKLEILLSLTKCSWLAATGQGSNGCGWGWAPCLKGLIDVCNGLNGMMVCKWENLIAFLFSRFSGKIIVVAPQKKQAKVCTSCTYGFAY